MSTTIWKYPLEVTDEQRIAVPKGAVLLSVQVQHAKPTLWALVDPQAEPSYFTIAIYGTGNPVDEIAWDSQFLGTIQLCNGGFVGHVFAREWLKVGP